MDLIRKIRADEEKLLKKCGVVRQKMKAVSIDQRNISMDVQNTIMDMEELHTPAKLLEDFRREAEEKTKHR